MSFDEVIKQELRLVIPADHFEEVRPSTISGLEGFTILTSLGNSQYDRIRVLTINTSFVLNPELEERLIVMRNRLESHKELLLLISDHKALMASNDLSDFISESFRLDSPYFLGLNCYPGQGYQTTIDGVNFENLHRIIRDTWSGWLRYDGPVCGVQQVNIELMKDTCWKCEQPMRTVTGLVFPDQQLSSWDNDRWLYYNHMVGLQGLQDNHALVIQAFAKQLRQIEPAVTPISYRYSHTISSSYWAACCPHCNALRGDFYMQEARTNHLFDFTSRSNGALQYYPITLDVDRPLIRLLNEGLDGCPHTRITGWCRAQNI